MRNYLTSMAICVGLLVAALGAQGPAPAAPPDTAALRTQYEQWRTDFKTWGRWAPVGQESRGTSSLITPQKVASALKLARSGIVVSLAHAEPQVVAADVNAKHKFFVMGKCNKCGKHRHPADECFCTINWVDDP